jgi:hypothetical protein
MDSESVFTAGQTSATLEAIKLRAGNVSVPSIESYYPKTKSEIETQLFNLYGRLPARLTSEEDIAMWILEGENINRSRVCAYLGRKQDQSAGGNSTGIRVRREDIPKGVLKRLANKICSLELAKGFVEGMKFFVPVVGCWDAVASYANSDGGGTVSKADTEVLCRILTEYVNAHLKYSDKPIFTPSAVNDSNIDVVVEVALCVLSLSKALQDSVKSSSAAMADFFAALRAILREQQPASSATTGSGADSTTITQFLKPQPAAGGSPAPLSLSMKAMTDLFVATSTGLPLSSLAHSAQHSGSHHHHGAHPVAAGPSYLFASAGLQGNISLGFSLEDPFQPYFARLTSDALYIFEQATDTGGAERTCEGDTGTLVACIPLESVHLRTDDSTAQSTLLTLVPLSGNGLPFIQYAPQPSQQLKSPADGTAELPAYSGPSAVTYRASIFLRLHSSRTGGDDCALETWVDALETAAWECRSARTKTTVNKQ